MLSISSLRGQNSPRIQGDLCPLESESSASGKCHRGPGGLPKALGEIVLTAQWKASMQPLPGGQSLTGRGEWGELGLERGRKKTPLQAPLAAHEANEDHIYES